MAQDSFGNYRTSLTSLSESFTINGAAIGGAIYSYEGDPNGNVSATGPAICFGSGAYDGQIWRKITSGTSNSEWQASVLL